MTKTNAPIKESLTTIKGTRATIYQIERSRYWYVRCRINGKYQIRSTHQTDKKGALKVGEETYFALVKQDGVSDKSHHTNSFYHLAIQMNERTKLTSRANTAYNELGLINNHLKPYFKDKPVTSITYSDALEFYKHVENLRSVKKHTEGEKLATATKRYIIMTFKKVLHFAHESGVLENPPHLPRRKRTDTIRRKRDYLEWNEYSALQKTIVKLAANNTKGHRTTPITLEMKLLNNFMINTFIRPSDLKVLKHKHISIEKDRRNPSETWLRLTHPATKTVDTPMISTQWGPRHYQELKEFRKENPINGKTYLEPDDYVFLPTFRDDEDVSINETKRKYALQTLGKCLQICVENTKPLEGKEITLYSMRHTSIMFRMMYGDQIDTLHIARNARTSQQMIERFYAAYLTGDHVRESIHSTKNRVNLPSES